MDLSGDISFYSLTSDAWEAMYEDCRNAQSSILYEQYIVCDDPVGRRFLALLAEKARSGVSVTLCLDRIGARGIYDSPEIAAIRAGGGLVIFYNDIFGRKIWTPWRWLPRNHLKLLLVDSAIAYVGGVCMADYMASWRDLFMRAAGPYGAAITRDYAAAIRKKGVALAGPPEDDTLFHYVVSDPRLRGNPIYRALLRAIHGARTEIEIVTPYFMPPRRLSKALLRAAARGVRVRVVVSGQDVPLVYYTSLTYLPRLIRRGIRFHAYRDTVCHAKYAIIDGEWAMLGSMNLDYLSLIHNREGNLVTTVPCVIGPMRSVFAQTVAAAEALQEDFLKDVPLRYRLLGYIGRPFRKLM